VSYAETKSIESFYFTISHFKKNEKKKKKLKQTKIIPLVMLLPVA